VHTNKIDIQLNKIDIWLISGTVKSTQLQWLHARSLLYEQMLNIPDQRLLSRRSVSNFDPHPSTKLFSIPDAWMMRQQNCQRIMDSNVRPPGFDLRRHNCVLLNRFQTEQERCAHFMHRWGFVKSPACDCCAEEQTMRHIVDDCPLRLFADGLTKLCAMSDETVEYLSGLDLNL
jgi:hypothetical protein